MPETNAGNISAVPGGNAAPAQFPTEDGGALSGAPSVEGEALADGMIATGLPHDLSPWGMFEAAHPVVQAVIICLALASVATWTVWLVKTIEIRQAKKRVAHIRSILGGARTLDEAVRGLKNEDGPERALVHSAMAETRLSADGVGDHGKGLKERISSQLERLEMVAARRMTRGMGVLATIGSISPFVGLFGTVWGIMNSFVGIARAQTTNLAVVAPGIAEALLATAIGLAAAIPAVVIYNHFTRSIGGYRLELGNASADISRIVSRDLDRRIPPVSKAAG